MRLSDLLLTASANLLRNKARTFLTIIAVFIGAMTITLTNGIGTGIKSYLDQQLGDLGATNVLFITRTNTRTSPANGPAKYTYDPDARVSSGGLGQRQLMMTSKDLDKVRTVPHLTDVAAAHSPAPDYVVGKRDRYQLTLTQRYGDSTAAMVAGRGVDNNSSSNQISVPESYVGPLGYGSDEATVGRLVTIGITDANGKQSTVMATVTGIQEKNLLGQAASYANAALTEQLNDRQNVGLPRSLADTFLVAHATFPANFTGAQIKVLKDQLSAKGFTALTIKDEEDTVFTTINVIIIVLDLFGVIALLAASFGIVNTLLMSVQERTKEIGLMKALGMGPRRIFMLFSIEAVLIGFWGSLLGVGFAALIGTVVNAIGRHGFLKDFPGLSLLTFPVTTIVLVMLAIMLIAFLAGTLPALRASRKDPIDALRYE